MSQLDLEVGLEVLFELFSVGDYADGALTAPKLAEGTYHLLQGLLVKGAKPLIYDEEAGSAFSSGLGYDAFREGQRQRQRSLKGLPP